MHEIMDVREDTRDPLVRQLFVEQGPPMSRFPREDDPENGNGEPPVPPPPPGTPLKGMVCTLKEGFGFIKCPEYPNNVFFHFSAVTGCDFEDLNEGDLVTFKVEQRDKGPVAKDVTVQNEA